MGGGDIAKGIGKASHRDEQIKRGRGREARGAYKGR